MPGLLWAAWEADFVAVDTLVELAVVGNATGWLVGKLVGW